MPSVSAPAKVLVTGASGFVAAWVIKDLLDQGYAVRGTFRSIDKAKHFNDIFKAEVEKGQLEFVEVPDMSVAGAFDVAVVDVDAVLHVASPVTVQVDDPDGESIL
jgi:nucleoside-diphosphate-sugar epimerase